MKVYNSLSRKKEQITTSPDKQIKLYVCGVTPYDTTHVGHAFTYVLFDTLIRFLQFSGYAVTYVQNVTDIDDDILRKAKEEKRDWQELGTFWTNRFLTDMRSLNVLPPAHQVKATDTIPEIVHMVAGLMKKGYAYENKGNVYFDVKKFPNYGKLSHYNEQQMLLLLKERGGDPSDPLKQHPLDFILWQKSQNDEPFWESPWGKGRPGWHIECSAMVWKYLGEQVDIHGGGHDLIYPHHESETAQSESFTGKKPFVKYWSHTGAVMYEGEKMSKSLGNLVLVVDLLKNHSANTIRFVLLSHHYRSPWEFRDPEMDEAEKRLALLRQALHISSFGDEKIPGEQYRKQFISLMEDDMKTPEALHVLEVLSLEIIEKSKKNDVEELQKELLELLQALGFTI